jgi:hypothetical protein
MSVVFSSSHVRFIRITTRTFGPGDTWDHAVIGKTIRQGAPARISRGMPLPEVVPAATGAAPFVVASRHANGAVAVATLGRYNDAQGYYFPRANISIDVSEGSDAPAAAGGSNLTLGVFGHYGTLTVTNIRLQKPTPSGLAPSPRLLSQDLLAAEAIDITQHAGVRIEAGLAGSMVLSIEGALIDTLGTAAATRGDISEPGLVLCLSLA